MTNKFDEKTEQLRKILSENIDSVPENVAKQLEILVSGKNEQFKQLSATTKDITNISSIVNDTLSKTSNAFASDNEIIKDKLNQTTQALLDPIRITFAREISKYVDAISTEDKNEKIVTNLISTPYSALNDKGEFEIKKDTRINPEWMRLISSGYIPNVKEGAKPTPQSNYTKDDGDNDVPLTASVPSVVTKMAGVFKNSFNKTNFKPEIQSSDSQTSVKIQGTLNVPDVSKTIKGTPIPKITVDYQELGDKFTLRTSTAGSLYSNTYGLVPYDSEYEFTGKVNNSLPDDLKKRIAELETNNCEASGKEDIFSLLIYDKIRQCIVLQNNEDLSLEVIKSYSDKFKIAASAYAQSTAADFAENRLLKKLPATSYEHQKLMNKTEDDNVLILLNLINFIPEATEDLKKCGKEPHPLNLNAIFELVNKLFNSVAAKQPCEDEDPDNPMVESGLLATALIAIRLSCFEYLLKSLFIYDQLNYKEELVNDPLLIDYMCYNTQIDLIRSELYQDAEKIIKKYYDFLKKENFIIPEDEDVIASVGSARIIETSTKNNTFTNIEIPASTKEFKVLTRCMFRKVLKYVKKLIGANKPFTSTNPETVPFLGSLKVYDTYYNSGKFKKNSTYKNNLSRFKNIDIDGQPFILERYISLPISKNQSLNKHMSENYINGVIDFENFGKLMNFISNGGIRGINKNTKFSTLFSEKIKIGMRLCYVEKTSPLKDNEFKISNTVSRQIKPNLLNSDKINNFVEFNESTKTNEKYNGFILIKKEIEYEIGKDKTISNFIDNPDNNDIGKFYLNSKKALFDMIKNDVDYRVLFQASLMSEKLPTIISVYSVSAMTTEKMKYLFTGTKKRLKRLNDSLKNIDNYTAKADYELAGGNAGILQSDFNNIGNPNGAGGFDMLWYLITTPILILKGITQLMDPNIAIASQIVNAAQAGLLFPKFDDQGNASYPGDPLTLPTALASMMLLPMNLMPPGMGIGPPVTPIPGMLYWALEPLLWKLPFFQNQTSKQGSDAANRAKADYGLDIGAHNFSCEEDQDA